MSVEMVKLPGFVIADLYKNCLIEPVTNDDTVSMPVKLHVTINEAPVKKGTIKYFGENQRKIAAIVNEPGAEFISSKDMEFLTKILQACNLKPSDIAIVNIHKQAVDYTNISDQLNAEYVLLLGIDPPSFGLSFSVPQFQVQKHNECTFIYTPELSTLRQETQQSRILKGKLWVSLKTAFKL